VRNANGESAMVTPPTSGACNSCHAATFRILAP
jgi:hypothetical protein